MNKNSHKNAGKIPFHKKTSDMNNYSTSHQNTQQAKKFVGNLTGKHYNYLRFNRKMPRNWVVANFESITQKEAKEMGFSAPSDGILLKSVLPSLQSQFRPNDPKVEKKAGGTERVIKYITPFGCEIDAMLPVHPDYPNFWTDVEELKKRCWIINDHPYLFVTEGFIDALIATANGFPTIALTGVENGLTGSKRDPEGKRFLVPTLRHFAELGFGFIIGFDADSVSNRNVINAQKTLVKQLQLFEDTPTYNITGLWTMTSDGSDKGIGDYIQKHGADAFRQNVLRRAEPIANWLIKVNEQLKAEGINADDELPPKTTKLETQYTQVKLVVGDKIKFNELTKEIEFNGKPIDFDNFKLKLAKDFKLELKGCPKEDLKAIIVEIAEENSYHPVREYFSQCNEEYSDTSILDGLAKRYFGTNNSLYQAFIRKTLIAAVARVYEPGCKVDTALILQGGQGTYKSTFFRALASDNWFCDDMGSPDNKDEVMKLHTSLFTEWAELENIFSKSDISKIKGFLTTSSDRLRMPYGARTKLMPRMGVIVGSTNKSDVLRDPTGSRRFWVIPVTKTIPIDLLVQERDAIWGAAVQAYKNGEKWYLNHDEQKQSDANNEAFSSVSPWLDDIENYLEGKAIVTTEELLNLVGVDKDNLSQAKRAQTEISDIMTTLKWEPAQNIKGDDGKRKRGYKRPVVVTTPEPEPTPEDVTQPPTGCVDDRVSQNPDTEGDTQPTQPTQQNSQNSKPIETKPDDFQIGDRVIEAYPRTIGDNKRFGIVVEVERPNGCKGIYTVEWENANVTGLRNDMYSHEIEHYDG
ncbi:VapE domain-containing protein [Planktothrix sp. FACHB-1365]|uniref:VapE domain-containing protein n=1 Tax=Planktothrix sp. FACHB-1365 TaxID=2692855 RepID=UPI001683D089|nr:VapE domain-containing protein [Planktothrix sp. FACHB-1365]MBD2481552.1 DUF3854 domain-containing protein [Planktothrix sp. FACHB-1365]